MSVSKSGKVILWWLFASSCIAIGLYPLIYFFVDSSHGLLSTKPRELLQLLSWNIGFYGHISFGGLALITGWLQFSSKFRNKYLHIHRKLGLVYLIAVMISGMCGFFIGIHATGGIVSSLGFIALAVIWLGATILAYLHILKGHLHQHQYFMIISYAACFGAVTLRIWLPLLSAWTGSFLIAYKLVAWVSWVPNIIIALIIIQILKRKQKSSNTYNFPSMKS